jgi:hypothetical protein
MQFEGSKPFTPTRLEWLAVELNANFRVDSSPASLYTVGYIPVPNEDAIAIDIVYDPSVDRRIINTAADQARKGVAILSKRRGWESWLKIKEQIEMSKFRAAAQEKPN